MNTRDLSLSDAATEPAPGIGPETSPETHDAIVQPVLPVLPDIELRVLLGPQAGCRLALAPDQGYSLGTSDDCSVVLVGQDVQPEHARLRVQADMVEITPVQGTVRIEGTELTTEADTWSPGSVFLVGRVVLCVDQTDAPWPSEDTIMASAALALQGPAGTGPDEDADADADDEDDDFDDDPDDADLQNAADDSAGHNGDDDDRDASDALSLIDGSHPDHPATDHRPGVSQGPAATVSGKTRRTASIVLAASGLVLLIAAGLASWIGWGPAASGQRSGGLPGVPPVAGLPAADPAEPAPPATPGPPATAPEPAAPSPEQVAARLDALVQQLRSPGRVAAHWTMHPQGPRVRIAGIDPAHAEAARARVEAARAETGPVEVVLLEPADIAARFREALQTGNLQRKFTADPADPDQLTYKASLTMEDIPVWEKLFLSFTEAHGNVPPVTVQVSTDLDRLSSRIGSVVGGSFPYIVTPEGHRIAPGGSLMGRTVASVQIGEIVFADGVRYRFTP